MQKPQFRMLKWRLQPIQHVHGAEEQRLEHLSILMPCLQPVSLSHLLRQTSMTTNASRWAARFRAYAFLSTLRKAGQAPERWAMLYG